MSAQDQHAIRRSTRLPLEIPVRVTSLDPAVKFSEPAMTTLVNAHGCGVTIQREVPKGIQVRLEIVSAKRHTTAHIAEVVSLGGDPESWLLGLELDTPGNFWGIEYAPSDWKLEDTPEPPTAASARQQSKAAEPEQAPASARATRRWRLTDISPGACYLEAASPFPVSTPVLVSIRVADAEFLLDGVVRASYAESGMGVEFAPRAPDHAQRIEQLISALTKHREVPRIFVGRKEHPGDANFDATTAAPDGDDRLLQLICQTPPLPLEQFHSELRAQRLHQRKEERIEIALPVLLAGSDINGRPLDQRVLTVNVSRRGALLKGVHGELRRGDTVFLTRAGRREEFRVAWVGAPDSDAAGEIGVTAVAANSPLWQEALESAKESSETTN